MKGFFRWCRAHKLAACYGLALALTVLGCLAVAGWDALGFATGRLYTVQLPLSGLQAQDILCTEEGVWVTAGSDPQLLVQAQGQPIRNIVWQTSAPAAPAEAYYASDGADYSLRRRVYAGRDAGGGLVFRFPLSGGSTVRLDPAAGAGVVLAENGADACLTVNARLPLWRYFCLRGEQWCALAVLPAVAAALWDQAAFWLAACRGARRRGRA